MNHRKIAFRKLTSPLEWKSGNHEFLLIGPNALQRETEIVKLSAELRKGGHILVLEHNKLPDLTAGNLVTLPYGSVGVYPAFTPNSPLYGALGPSDLRFWNTEDKDMRTVIRMIKAPSKGNFRILAFGAYQDGIKASSAALLDFGVGAGTVRYCQFNLSRSLASDPAAERLFVQMLNVPPAKFGKENRAVLTGKDGKRILSGRAGVTDFATAFESLDLGKIRALVCDGDALTALKNSEIISLKKWLSDGGKMLLLDAEKTEKTQWNALLGEPVRFEPFASDRARFSGPHALTSGLSHGDLFWSAGKAEQTAPFPTAMKTKRKKLKPEIRLISGSYLKNRLR